MNGVEGFIFLNKPHGVTSFYCVNKIKRLLGGRIKIGHAGTLDSFATGLLIIGVTRAATRQIKKIMELDKWYIAKAKLGQLTDTLDFTGVCLQEEDVSGITSAMLEESLKSFGTSYEQIPPIYSALKYKGRALSTLARRAQLSPEALEKIAIQKRRIVNLYDLTLMDVTLPYFTIRVHTSHGTYIRVLLNDIAQKVGTYATTYELTRIAIGPFTLQESIPLKELRTIDDIVKHSIPIERVLMRLDSYRVQ